MSNLLKFNNSKGAFCGSDFDSRNGARRSRDYSGTSTCQLWFVKNFLLEQNFVRGYVFRVCLLDFLLVINRPHITLVFRLFGLLLF